MSVVSCGRPKAKPSPDAGAAAPAWGKHARLGANYPIPSGSGLSAFSVQVSKQGNDTNCTGTDALPCLTISRGLVLAASLSLSSSQYANVYVGPGVYAESVALPPWTAVISDDPSGNSVQVTGAATLTSSWNGLSAPISAFVGVIFDSTVTLNYAGQAPTATFPAVIFQECGFNGALSATGSNASTAGLVVAESSIFGGIAATGVTVSLFTNNIAASSGPVLSVATTASVAVTFESNVDAYLPKSSATGLVLDSTAGQTLAAVVTGSQFATNGTSTLLTLKGAGTSYRGTAGAIPQRTSLVSGAPSPVPMSPMVGLSSVLASGSNATSGYVPTADGSGNVSWSPSASIGAGSNGQYYETIGGAGAWTSMSGDCVTSSTGVVTCTQVQGTAANGTITFGTTGTAQWAGGASPVFNQFTTSSAVATNWTWTPQQSSATPGTGGNAIVSLQTPNGAGSDAAFQITRGGTQIVRMGQLAGVDSLWFGNNSTAATTTLQSDGSTYSYLTAPTAVGQLLNGATFLTYGVAGELYFGGSGSASADEYLDLSSTAKFHFGTAATSAAIVHDTTTGTTGASMSLQPQQSSNTNATGGNLVVALETPTGTGAEAAFQITRGGTQVARLGRDSSGENDLWLGTGTTSTTPQLISDGATYTYMNSGGALGLLINNAVFVEYYNSSELYFGSSNAGGAYEYFDLAAAAKMHFGVTATSATIVHDSLSSQTQGNNMTLQPQQSTQTTNNGGGNLVVALQTPAGSGVDAALQITRGGTQIVRLGRDTNSGENAFWLGSGTTSGTVSMVSDGSTYTYLSAPSTSGSAAILLGNATFTVFTNPNGVQLFTGSTDFGSGVGVLALKEAGTNPTTVTNSSGVVWEGNSGDGLHYTGPTTGSFEDYMVAPTWGSTTKNSQIAKDFLYGNFVRTTNATATTVLTIPLAANSSAAAIDSICTARCITGSTNCTADQMWSKKTLYGFRNSGGVVSPASSVAAASVGPVDDTSMTSAASSATVSGTNILIQVTGMASSTVDWTCKADVEFN